MKTILAKKFVAVVMRILVVKIVVAVVVDVARNTKVVLGSWHLAACSF